MQIFSMEKDILEGVIEKIITIKERDFVTCIIDEEDNKSVIVLYNNGESKKISIIDYADDILIELKKDINKNSLSEIQVKDNLYSFIF